MSTARVVCRVRQVKGGSATVDVVRVSAASAEVLATLVVADGATDDEVRAAAKVAIAGPVGRQAEGREIEL